MKNYRFFFSSLVIATLLCSCHNVKVEGNKFTLENVSFEMVDVEGGQFLMGDTTDFKHQVTLSSYKIGKTEVTQKLWELVMGSNPSEVIGPDLPVNCVSWDQCQEFISKLNKMTGYNFRLPTEAEWEFAARGGMKSKGYVFSGSNEIDEIAWFSKNSNYKPQAVAKKKPNELGLYDMSGNVNEWCNDWFLLFDKDEKPANNPQGPQEGGKHVYRGGAYDGGLSYTSVAERWGRTVEINSYYDEFFVNNRDCAYSNAKRKDIGLRLALSIEE